MRANSDPASDRSPGIAALVVSLGLALLAPGTARADTVTYKIQPILKLGDPAGDTPLASRGLALIAGPLNDRAQLLIDAGTLDGTHPDTLLQYDSGQFLPILVVGRDGPVGKWPKDVFLVGPLSSMNQSGNIVFAVRSQSTSASGTFLWSRETQVATAVALKGMPAGPSLTFSQAYGGIPAINNRDEIALVATVQNPSGPTQGVSGPALFLRTPDGQLQPVLLPGQELPGGVKVHSDSDLLPSLTDAGLIAFLARPQGEKQNSAYLWEQGALTPVLRVGAAAPGGGQITSVSGVFLNNANRNVLVTASVDGSRHHGLYLVRGGQLTPVAVPGQVLPDGSQFSSLASIYTGAEGVFYSTGGVSTANQAGEHVFLAALADGSTAAYRMEADGKLSLVLKNGTTTELGQITTLEGGYLAGINTQGQVALVVRTDGGPDMVVLLTPAAP